jgi:Skp family chaperone for outer membrane proteins
MRRVLAGALTLVLCCSAWLTAADTEKKEPVPGKATTSSAQTSSAQKLRQMQAQLKTQQEQIAKLLAQLQQTHQALQQAQQKLQADAQQTAQQAQTAQQQAVAVHEKANNLNHQVTEMQTTLGNVEQKPPAK